MTDFETPGAWLAEPYGLPAEYLSTSLPAKSAPGPLFQQCKPDAQGKISQFNPSLAIQDRTSATVGDADRDTALLGERCGDCIGQEAHKHRRISKASTGSNES